MASSSSSSSSCVIHPEVEDASLLMMEKTHISQYIWNGHLERVLVVRGKSSICSKGEQIPAQIIVYLEQVGFLEVAKFEFFQIEHTLISTLVERWRPLNLKKNIINFFKKIIRASSDFFFLV